jgi:hypothetical protein
VRTQNNQGSTAGSLNKHLNIARAKGIDCETVQTLMNKSEDSRISIKDSQIREFLLRKRVEGVSITLITNDEDLDSHCKIDGLPTIYVPELIANHILAKEK